MQKTLPSPSAQRAGRLSDHDARQRRPLKLTVHDAELIRCDGFGGTPFKSEPEREHRVVGVWMKWTGVLLSAEACFDHTTERVWDCVALNPVETPENRSIDPDAHNSPATQRRMRMETDHLTNVN